jgi:hypothetical protein
MKTQRFLIPVMALAIMLAHANHAPVAAQTCTAEAVQRAVEAAAETLRKQTAATEPELTARLKTLRDLKGWSADSAGDAKAYEAMQDNRLKELDETVGAMFAKLDAASETKPGSQVDCARVAEFDATSRDLEAVMRQKGEYMVQRLDALIVEARSTAPAIAAPATPPQAPPPVVAAAPPAPKAEPSAPRASPLPPWTDIDKLNEQPKAPQAQPRGWATTTERAPPAETLPPPPTTPPTTASTNTPQAISPDDGYSIDEIAAASENVFGKVTTGLGQVIEHAFRRSGRPVGYIVGREGGGAIFAGLRYGRGRLFMRNGDTREVFWHGPSIGADIGATGSEVMILVYRLPETEAIFAPFSGVDGSAYVVGGLGITFLSNGRTQLAPIRSGVGLRLGASVGYLRMTRQATWNPF